MPNINVLESKKQTVADLGAKMKSAAAGVLVDYQGITVEDDTILRKELREANVDYAVVKNTLTRFAAKEIGFDAFDEHLHGTTALAVCADDPIAPARILCKYAKTHENFKIKIGFMDGKIMEASEVLAIADLPSKEVLLAQVLYGFNTPITKLAIALSEIAKQKAEGEAPAPVVEAPVETAPVAEETAPATEEAPAEETAPEAAAEEATEETPAE